MMGNFITKALALVLGYAYPAYECFKIVELNKPEVEQLIFWCQYWILVAALAIFERVGESFISWLPMYSEAKLAFFVYLWYPKTKGTTYVYETFFRPYVAKHENEIDRNLLELRTRAGDIAVLYWQKAASYGQTRFLEILQYIALQSPSQSSRSRPVQPRQQPQRIHRTTSTTAAREQSISPQHQQQQTCAPSSPTKPQLQEPTKVGVPPPPLPVAQPSTSSALASSPRSEATALPTPADADDGEAMQIEVANAASKEDQNPPSPQETPMEEAIRMTRGRLRKRAATAVPSIR